MNYLVIKSNHGNHTGFNRKWEVLDEVSTLEDAQDILLDAAFGCSDNIIVDGNGLPYDINSNHVLYDGKCESFSYDGRTYMIISENDQDLFNGGSYGYMSNKIQAFFSQFTPLNKEFNL